MLEWLKKILGDSYTETIEKQVSDEIGKGFVARSDYNALKEEHKTTKAQIKERDEQLEALKTSDADTGKLKERIETLQAENKEKDEAHKAELYQLKVDTAVDKALGGAGVKNPLTVMPLLKLDKPVLKEDGTIEGLAEKLKTLSESEDTKFLFNAEGEQSKQFKGFVPAEKKDSDTGSFLTAEQLKNMTPEEVANNWDNVEKMLQNNKL